jgi:hypothetical protein
MPLPTTRLHVVRDTDAVSRHARKVASHTWPKVAGHLPMLIRYVLTAGSLGTVGYMLDGLMAAATFVPLGIMVTVILMAAMLGKRDDRSPFTRLMIILCVVTRQPPDVYLPAAGQKDRPAA